MLAFRTGLLTTAESHDILPFGIFLCYNIPQEIFATGIIMVDKSNEHLTNSKISSFIGNVIGVIMILKELIEQELEALQKYFEGIQPQDIVSQIPAHAMFYSASSALYRKENVTMGELSKSISAPLSSTTRIVNWLVDNGYAQRLADPEDRRIVRVALTEEGRKLHVYIEERIIQRIRKTLELLTVEEQGAVIAIFDKVAEAFNLKGDAK